jgi:hypothetical protein
MSSFYDFSIRHGIDNTINGIWYSYIGIYYTTKIKDKKIHLGFHVVKTDSKDNHDLWNDSTFYFEESALNSAEICRTNGITGSIAIDVVLINSFINISYSYKILKF